MAAKLKKIRHVLGKKENANMQQAMSQMMGAADAEVEIIVPKFKEITDQSVKVMKILTTFATFTSLRRDFAEISGSLDEILKFATTLKDSLDKYTKYSEAKLYSMNQERLNVIYKDLKNNAQIKMLITVAGEIKTWCPNIAEEEKLDMSFVLRSVGAVCPFSFSSLELGYIWRKRGTTDAVKKYIMMVIHKVYRAILEIYNQITSPDIDTEQMSACVFDALSMLGNVPELKGCKKAFMEIQKHTVLFKSNFGSYYKDAVVSNNSNLIIERYLMDVSASSKDTAILSQLGKVIAYVRRQTKARGGMTKENAATFSMLESNLGLAAAEDDEKDDTDVDAAAGVTITPPDDTTAPGNIVNDVLDKFLEAPADDTDEKEVVVERHENPFWKPDFNVPKLIFV